MNKPITFLENLQLHVEENLKFQDLFKDIPILSHRTNNVESCLNEHIESGTGLYILILNPLPLRIVPSSEYIGFEDIHLRIQITENICSNFFSLSALATAELVSKSLHNFRPLIKGWKGWIALDETHPWKEIKNFQNPNLYTIEINFHIRGSAVKL